MTPAQFIKKQASLEMTNRQMARLLRKSAQSICNYRHGRQRIPDHVGALIEAEEAKRKASASADA